MADPDFAKGATTGPGYDTTPGGLGLSPAYLGGATANASLSASSSSGTSFPASPADGQEYVYVADATNGVFWKFRWYAASSYWAFVGGPPLYSEVATVETTSSTGYAALSTVGPAIPIPFTADYDVEIGAFLGDDTAADHAYMSYDIGGTGAVDADAVFIREASAAGNAQMSLSRRRRKSGLTAVTLTAKYRVDGGTGVFASRYMAVWPVKK